MIILSSGHSILIVTMRNSILCMGDVAIMSNMCLNTAHFYWFFSFFRPKGPYITLGSPKKNLFNSLCFWGKIRSKPYATCHDYSRDPQIPDVGQNALTRAFVIRIFAFISRFSIPANIDIYIFWIVLPFWIQRYATRLCSDQPFRV